MIIAKALESLQPPDPAMAFQLIPDPGGQVFSGREKTKAKQDVSPELSKTVATVYRCANTISDDVANMPLQQFQRLAGRTDKVMPDAITRNIAYLMEVSPNRWMTPFILKKTAMLWLLFWGNALIWWPASSPNELFVLPTNMSFPRLDVNGDLWYQVFFPNNLGYALGTPSYIPAVEVLHLMINSTNGIWGRSVLQYARETIGRRMGMSETQSSIQGQGVNPSAYVQVNGEVNADARKKLREEYAAAISGSENAGRLAVFDNKISKFEAVGMKLTDAQFLESMDYTDGEIANFFKFPEYKLNMGKQSYESNTQQDLDYLKSCLDPFLVQWEQAARLRWLAQTDQNTNYFKFIREAILRTDAKTRAELDEIRIRSGTETPNEAREHEDLNSYPLGDKFWMVAQNAEIGAPPAIASPVKSEGA